MKVLIHFGGQTIESDSEKISISFDDKQVDVITTKKLQEILDQNIKK